MRPVRAVLFDLDHTLFDTEKTERFALKALARAAGVPFGVRALETYRLINTHVWSEYRAGRLTSRKLRVLRFHLWLQKLGQDPGPARRLAPLYLKEFSSRGDLIAGARAAVRSISHAGLRVGVVTNGIDRVQRRRLRASGLMDAFKVVVTSERAGMTKPDPRIIEIALKRLRVAAEDTVYVGDDPQVDGLAANRASVGFVWFNPGRAPMKPGPSVTVAHEITRLQDLGALLRPHQQRRPPSLRLKVAQRRLAGCGKTRSVIPAKAGIQISTKKQGKWIPAFVAQGQAPRPG